MTEDRINRCRLFGSHLFTIQPEKLFFRFAYTLYLFVYVCVRKSESAARPCRQQEVGDTAVSSCHMLGMLAFVAQLGCTRAIDIEHAPWLPLHVPLCYQLSVSEGGQGDLFEWLRPWRNPKPVPMPLPETWLDPFVPLKSLMKPHETAHVTRSWSKGLNIARKLRRLGVWLGSGKYCFTSFHNLKIQTWPILRHSFFSALAIATPLQGWHALKCTSDASWRLGLANTDEFVLRVGRC